MIHGEYRTPKRRHSSLFQRMQEEIQKISRKLSQAKGPGRQSSYQKMKSLRKEAPRYQRKQRETQQKQQKAKQLMFQTTNTSKQKRKNIHFQQYPQPSVIQTVRIKRKPYQQYNEMDQQSSYNNSGKKTTIPSKTLNRRLNFAVPYRQNRENHQDRILKLELQNQQLTSQIKKLQAVCSEQSYRLGYASAYFDDKCKKIQQQKQQFMKQNIYLQKLCQHYKSKSIKYKQNVRKYSTKKLSQSSLCQEVN